MANRTGRCLVSAICLCTALIAFGAITPLSTSAWAATKLTVYGDTKAAGWADWSWGAVTRNFANTNPVHAGSRSIAVTFSEGWCGFQLGRNSAVNVSAYDTLRFYVHGGSGANRQIQFQVGNSCASVKRTVTVRTGAWTVVDVPLAELGKPAGITFMYWFNPTENAQPVFYLDDVAFIYKGTAALPPLTGPSLNVNVNASRHAISPYIYGMSFTDENLAAELRLPLRRWGGNSTTRYNWENDTSNRASDWFFENIPNSNDPTKLPNGSDADRFVAQNQRTGTQTLLTVPLIGWTPKSRTASCGYSVSKYGAQQEVDPWNTDCGNGVRTNGTEITNNKPQDTSIEITTDFVEEWMAHLSNRFGTAAAGGVKFYNLDNEPMLWNSTHRDVHPAPTSYDEMKQRTVEYAAAIKAADPAAKTCGPVVWGWTAYFWSALDAEEGGDWWSHPKDRLAHGNVPFLEWYLRQMRNYQQQNGKRILDYLDVHFYPQGDGVFSESAGDGDVQALRLRSTRALWDRSYTDESWIGEPVYLVPRMKQWVADNYPGTRTCVSEYSWGGLCHMNGALAQADVLGIFGREGLDMAALWGPPTSGQPGAFAFRMYLNYNGAGGKFGNMSVRAVSGNQARLAVYAAERTADGKLTLMIINKTNRALTSKVNLSGFVPSGSAKVYRYGMNNLAKIVPQPDQTVGTGGFSSTFAANSITLVVIPGSRS